MKTIISISLWDFIWSMGIGKGTVALYENLKGYSNKYNIIHFMPLDKNNNISKEIYENKNSIIKNNFKIAFIKSKIFNLFYKLTKIKYFGNFLFIPIILILYYFELKKYIIRNKLYNQDIIFYGHSSYCAILAYSLGKKFNKKNIGRYYGAYKTYDALKNRVSFKYLYNYVNILGFKVNNTKKIIADDGTNGDKVFKLLGYKNYLHITDGMSEKSRYKNYYNKKQDINIVMASRLVECKRVDIAIKAIIKLNELKTKNKIKLHIFGDGNKIYELKKIANKNLSTNIIFYGAISGNKVLDYIYNCDLFLSTSDFSNLSNGLYQALYFGKPIIATNTGNTKKYIINNYNGFLVNNINELSEKITYIANNYNKLEKYGKNSKIKAEQNGFISWKKRMEKEISYINN